MYPKNENENKINRLKLKAEKNHELINETLMFWTFKSFHFELRKTLPNLSKVALNFELRSNKTRK